MQEASDTQASVINTYRDLETEARERGWVKYRHGWVCPYCAAHRPAPGKEDNDNQAAGEAGKARDA
ncbi:hypothetical protein [Pseudomonas phage Persinger]|uniref:Uncharacterized protein n=1 Tax=Pseudomonas phage Persinger TaxID=2749430 RepID=A0A7D7EYR1_9CAUD|nr:hypothetical protein KB682_gp19 [Pseudomonas phage Persinger]QMP19211.1 hypothetical protein [Pseudomonas phage Persinger]